jgi:hypothetical protein
MDLTILTCRTEGRGFGPIQLALPVHLALLLLLLVLLVGAVAAVEAAGGSAEHAVMAGIMAGDAADDGALDAALGVGGRGRAQHEQRGSDGDERGFHDRCLRMRCRRLNERGAVRVPALAEVKKASLNLPRRFPDPFLGALCTPAG